MLKFRFEGQIDDLHPGIEIFAEKLGFMIAEDGIPVEVEKNPCNILVEFNNNKAYIKYEQRIHFFRALGLLVEGLQRGTNFTVIEKPQFTMNGVMIDASRNGVMTVESIKKVICKMALMGLNMIMMYTEDTYTIENEPYFGYMRGKYSYKELRECDDYADIFGIEMMPCIQTLGHLEQFLKWDAVSHLKDTEMELLVGSDDTYKFLEKAIKAASAPFRSKRIHIGMDEAHGLGLGRYLQINGFRRRFDIMTEHLNRVVEITSKYNLKPMIWSDMYFRLGSETGNYYDLDSLIPEEVIERIPKEVQLVYWDYYHDSGEFYEAFIKKHRELGSEPLFAGGLWTWSGICMHYDVAFRNTNAALNACKHENVKEVFTTMWGDNGSESNFFSSLLGMQLYAEHGYAEEVDMEKLKRRVKFCTGIDYDAYMDIARMDEMPGVVTKEYDPSNPSKYLLWQDILIGLFDCHIDGLDMDGHYAVLEKRFRDHRKQNSESDFVFRVIEKLCSVLKLKSNAGIKLKKAYDINDMHTIRSYAVEKLPELSYHISELREAHRQQWFETYKAFGWEVLDVRYGGLLARVDTTIKRLKDYLEGRINRIEELEEERLRFDSPDRPLITGTNFYCTYHRIATANVVS